MRKSSPNCVSFFAKSTSIAAVALGFWESIHNWCRVFPKDVWNCTLYCSKDDGFTLRQCFISYYASNDALFGDLRNKITTTLASQFWPVTLQFLFVVQILWFSSSDFHQAVETFKNPLSELTQKGWNFCFELHGGHFEKQNKNVFWKIWFVSSYCRKFRCNLR